MNSRANAREKLKVMCSFCGPERARNADGSPGEVSDLDAAGPHKFATILLEEAKQLLAMDRYERRALSRRKFAICGFDEAKL